MKGIAKIKGSLNPKIGEDSFYEVVEFHKGTPMPNPNSVKWKLFKKNNGKWEEAKGNSKTGMKVAFNFSPRSYGKEVLVEAYLFEPEMKSPPGLVVKPVLGPRKIVNTEILNANGDKITKTPKYGQSITLKVTTQNMPGEKLNLSLWERDTLKDSGHDPKGNTRLWSGQSKTIDLKGVVEEKIMLTLAMKSDANKSLFDGSEHEYYLLAEATGMKTISTTTLVSIEEVPTTPAKKTDEKPKEAKPIAKQTPVKIKNAVGADKIKADDSNKVVKVTPTEKVEGIIAAYFAKEEYTIKTDEKVGTQYYRFKNEQKKGFDKERTAVIIMEKVTALVKADKKYVKTEDIKKALVEKSYKKDDPISFNLYKLGANFIRVNSAPLEEEVYVVANTYLLNGKEVTIKIKEKEAVLVDANADVMVLEAKENGAEITTLKATVDNGIAKVKIKLRPKEDEDLKKWKEKLANGIKDGTHKYTVKNTFTVSGDLDKIASSIEKKSNEALAPKHTVKKADISALLAEGATYPAGTSLEFPKYKKADEMLWLKAECQGDIKKHEGDFLKKDGEYFVIGRSNCSCNRDLTVDELDIILKKIRGNQDTSIFYADNCNLDDKSKNSFITELNKTLKKYEINTCIRKVHFLAQIYLETDKLKTTLEYASGSGYNPGVHDDAINNGNTQSGDGPKYKGRGLMQLTWKNNYQLYKGYSGIDVITNYEKVSDELKIAIDSAGWYFKQGKRLSSGDTWTVPDTSFSKYDGSTGKQFNKTTYTYDGISYGAIDMNLLADKDYIDTISWLVNGGGNGRTERREYLKKLKEIDFFKCGLSKWHDPVDNPQLCLYSQGGGEKKPWHGSFGPTIRDGVNVHTGMDLFAKPGTNVYACVKSEVVRSETNNTMFGEMIVLKVIDEETIKSRRKNPFVLKYSHKSEIESQNFDHDGAFYLVYAHLKERKVEIGDTVEAGKVIGLTGTSGNNGVPFSTKNPHLHFEIMNVERQAGLNNKCNPGVYLTYKDEDNLTTSDIAEQEDAKTDSKFWTQ